MNFKKLLSAIAAAAVIGSAMTGCAGGGDAITVISREDGSGTRGAFVELTGVEAEDESGNKSDMTTAEAIIVNSTSVVMTQVQQNTSAIGYISLGSLNDTVKAVTVDGVTASADTIKDGSYKISRPFNIATTSEVSDATADFIAFILSDEGQAVVSDGYVTVGGTGAFTSTNPSGKVVVGGSTSVSPVMEKLIEAYAAINPNVTIELQTSDSSTGMKNAAEGSYDIGMASRELKDSELETLTPTVIALDGIAVIVNNENAVSDLSVDEIKSIYTGEITSWSEVE